MPVFVRRGLIALLVIAVLVLGVVFGTRALYRALTTHTAADGCTVGQWELDTGQAAIASTMVGTVLRRELPERASVLVIAAALQESRLRNLALGDGDRDSVGVLQQRPSQGWGTPEQLNDVHYATGKFLDALLKDPKWASEPLADAIQKVQISADGGAYAVHETEAQALSATFVGKTPAGITCRFGKPSQVAAAATVAAQVAGDLPVNPPTAQARQVTVPGAGWATAAWFVANADRLGLDSVSYAAQTWVRGKPWKPDAKAGSSAVVATLH